MIQWRKYQLHGIAASAVALTLGLWLYANRWTSAEAALAQHFNQALLEVRHAIAYTNDRGGLLDPTDTDLLIGRYESARDHAAQVTEPVLDKLHPQLAKVWNETFLPSTNLFIRALRDQDRDLARHAGLLQDDWVRWLQKNGHRLDIPAQPSSKRP